jgi:hypothetical protein
MLLSTKTSKHPQPKLTIMNSTHHCQCQWFSSSSHNHQEDFVFRLDAICVRPLRFGSTLLTLTLACLLLPIAARAQAPGTCDGISLGTTATAGTVGGDLNGFVPFPSDNAWNTNISNSPVDPNSAAIVATWSTTIPIINITIPTAFTVEFGAGTNSSGVPDNGIPYIVVDSTVTPSQPIDVTTHAAQGDVVVAPFPSTAGAVPIEGAPADCAGWPNTPASTNQVVVLDRAGCWLYELYGATSCNGQYEAPRETIWDMSNDESRPWGWISSDSAGLPIFPGLVRYDEASSGAINHAIAVSIATTNGDAHGGYYVLPASYSATTTATADAPPMGTRLRLSPTTNISSLSAINQAIATAMMTYGLIVTDNTNNFGIEGTPDARWDDTDLGLWATDGLLGTAPNSTNLQVIEMSPAYPGMDNVSALTSTDPEYAAGHSLPVIDSFTANGITGTYAVIAGKPVTFEYTVTGASYVYIDKVGPVRLTSGSGSTTITSSVTDTYTLYATNAWGRTSSSIEINVPNTVVTPPVFNPSPAQTGILNAAQKVTISTPTSPSATIYYTTNGTAPTTASTLYSGSVTVLANCATTHTGSETLEAIAVVADYAEPSAASTATYTCGAKAATPTFAPRAGTYDGTQTVTISDTTTGATIYYTTNGTAPTTASTSTVIGGTITVAVTQTVEAIAVLAGDSNSNVGTAIYTINAAQLPTPTFTPPAGTYTTAELKVTPLNVTISDTNLNAAIYYTTNGGTPTTASTLYSAPIPVTVTTTIRAIAVYTGFSNSAVGSATYTLTLTQAATPTFSPATGSYATTQTVTISDATAGTTIYYTVTAGATGTAPTTASTLYSGPITVANTEVIEAIAVETYYSNSVVGTGKYTITDATQVGPLTITPGTGTYSATSVPPAPLSVTISDATTPTAAFYYTTDNSTPVYPVGGTTRLYTGPLTISATTTLKAIGQLSGDNNSTVATAIYTLSAAATPGFSPVAGTYAPGQSVTITDSSANNTIYYTTNGNAPTTASAVYSTPIPLVGPTETLRAIAIVSGDSNSAVGSAAYTINTAATPSFSPAANIPYISEFTAPQTVTISDATAGATIYYTTNGTTPTTASASTVSGGTITVYTSTPEGSVEVEALAVKTGLANSTVGTVTYYFDIPAVGAPSFSPGTGVYSGVQTVTISDATAGTTIYYTITSGTTGTTPTTGSTSAVSGGTITVTPASVVEAFAAKSGYASSAVVTATYSTESAAPTPTFNPPAGSYAVAQNVAIGDGAPGAVIYYTTNGTAPTTASSRYGGIPITVVGAVSATTLEAIATASNYSTSAVGTAVYNIPTPPALTTPTPGTQLPGTSVAFTWTPGSAATHFELWLGSTGVGSSNLYNSGAITGNTTTANNLPSNGEKVNARLYYLLYGVWYSLDYTYTAYGTPVLPALTTPAPNTSTALSGTSVTFTWTPGNIATEYQLLINTTSSTTLYNSGTVTTTSVTATNLPSNGETLIVRLSYLVEGAWQYTDYTYVSSGTPTLATLTTPTPSSKLGGTSQAFTWNPSNLATHFQLWLGTSVGSSNLYDSGSVTALSENVSGLPDNGETLYARLYSLINGAWQYNSYTFTAAGTTTLPALTTPAPNTSTALSGTSVTFTWTPGNIATEYQLLINTTSGTTLYDSGTVTTTSVTATNLPSNGETLDVRLSYLVEGAWQYTNYTYVAYGLPTPAVLTTPTPNTSNPLSSTSATFVWTPGNIATHFELWIGTTGVGSSNLYNSGSVTVTTETVSVLPSNGQKFYVRLYYLINGAWEYTDYTYVASGAPIQPALTTPAPNTSTALSGTSVTFTWTPGNIATEYQLLISNTSGTALYDSGTVTTTSVTATNLPSNGETLDVRLSYLVEGAWQYTNYTYVATGAPTLATLTTPTPSSKLGGTSQVFTWNPGNLATHFQLWVGTSVGSSNLYGSGSVTALSENVSGLPDNGETLYARLYSLINGAWQYNSYTFTAAGSATLPALTTPAPNTSTALSGTSVTFTWTPGNVATGYQLLINTTSGTTLYNSGTVTGTSVTVSNLPNNGETLDVRLSYLVEGAWQYTNYTYVAHGSPTPAVLTTPTPNTLNPLSSTSVAFVWTPGNSATHFELWVGTTVGSSNLYNSGSVTVTTETVSNLPDNGKKLYVRLYYLINGAWEYTDYTYVAE